MKGISPMIATVLLIAFTVAVGGIVSLFLTGMTTTQTGLTEQTGINTTKCAGASIDILDASSTKIIYANPSTQTISSIKFTAGTGEIWTPTTTSLAPGVSAAETWGRGTNTSVTALGLCQGSIVVKGACKVGESCWS